MDEILNEQKLHLWQKIKKYARLGDTLPQWCRPFADNPDVMHKYLMSRSVEQLKYEIKQEHNMYIERKNQLIAELSGEVAVVLNQYLLDDPIKPRALRENWMVALHAIEHLWSDRLAGQTTDSEAIYAEFLVKATAFWTEFCHNDASLNRDLIGAISVELEAIESKLGDDEPKKKQDSADIQAFYDWWVDGAGQAYHEHDSIAPTEVIESIYGNDKFKGLSDLFKTLKSIGSGDPKFVHQRAALFNCLQGVMDYESGYVVYLKTFSDISLKLVTVFSEPEFPKYLACFAHFFTQGWVNGTRAVYQNPEEIKKISLLINLIMTIITKLKITDLETEQAGLLNFITNLSDVLHSDAFWGSFDADFAQQIESVFAADADISRLLVLNTPEPNLRRYIELIKRSSLDAAVGVTRINHLNAYLKDERCNLVNNPEVVKHVFELGLAGQESGDLKTALPTPHCLLTDVAETHDTFWHFLSKHTPVTENDSREITKLLNTYQGNEAKLAQIVGKLNVLPPNIPLDYINKALETIVGRTNYDTCLRRLETIEPMLTPWSAFMEEQDLVAIDREFRPPKMESIERFNGFLGCFKVMTPEKNKILFENIKDFTSVGNDRLELLATAFSKNPRLKKDELRVMCDLAQKIGRLPVDNASFLFEDFDKLLTTGSAEEQAQLGLSDARFRTFVEVLLNEEVASIDMPACAVKQLWVAWNAPRIKTCNDLKKAIKVVEMAMKLNSSNNDQEWDAHLKELNAPKKHERQRIMQHLEHKLLDLGEEFKERFEMGYKDLAAKVSVVRSTQSLNSFWVTDRYNIVLDPFRSMMKFMREIMHVAQSPYQGEIIDKKSKDTSTTNHLERYFRAQEQRYGNYWSNYWSLTRNEVREAQANGLFKSLKNITKQTVGVGPAAVTNPLPLTKADYYQAALDNIWRAQQGLLTSDREFELNAGYYLNTKGYSRLYDISMQMFAYVARQYLTDPVVVTEEKVRLNTILKEQFSFHVAMLKDRLPHENPLKADIDQILGQKTPNQLGWEETSNELDKLQRAIKQHRGHVPAHLRYLLTQIDLVCELYCPPPEGQAPAHR